MNYHIFGSRPHCALGVLLLICVISLYIKDINHLSNICCKCIFPSLTFFLKRANFFKNKFVYLFIHFWLPWAFTAAHRLSLVVASGVTLCCSTQASHCGGFSCCRAQALAARASVVVARRLSSCGSWALESRLSSCGARVRLLSGMWDLPGPGIESMSPALAGGLLTTVPPGKSLPL